MEDNKPGFWNSFRIGVAKAITPKMEIAPQPEEGAGRTVPLMRDAPPPPLKVETKAAEMQANWGVRGTSFTPVFSFSYNGEKNMGEIGPVKQYYMDYEALRLRSWQSYIESPIAQTVIKKYVLWVIGAGLRLKCEPNKTVLKSEGIDLQKTEDFNEITEARFTVFSNSKNSDYARMESLDEAAGTAYKNAILGGDVLVVQRYDKKTGVSVQLIDGSHVQSPEMGSEWFPTELPNGNCIRNGIEITPSGEHVNYFVRNRDLTFTTFPAKGKNSGLSMAFMVYGLRYRLDNVRGIPLLSVVLELLAKLDRYDEAAVGSAEERAKIVYKIVHKEFSTGENPLTKNLTKAYDIDANTGALPVDELGKQLANDIAVSTNKQTFNMPRGADMGALESTNELYFKDFFTVHIDLICAAIGMPPNVAMSQYNDSFSASRAATKDWEHTLKVARANWGRQFYQNIYNFWLQTEILLNKIHAPGFLQAANERNHMVLEAYRTARFTGDMFPHIDPVKEVTAERMKLGPLGAHLPLTTVELSTENLGTGESDGNMNQFSEELKYAKTLDLEMPEVPAPGDGNKPAKKEEED
jgi:capsid protein